MNINIFYSWQSDLPNKYNRGFLESCIKSAIKNIKREHTFKLEINLERDTKGEPGTPDIVETIFKKIRNSHIFIGDISIVSEDATFRKTPNPNVLVELGYAAGIVGWQNIVCLFNAAKNPVESLPFDLRLRRPIIYELDETTEDKSLVKDNLIKGIESALKKIDFNLTLENKLVRKEFALESDRVQFLAVHQPEETWNALLIEELIRDKIKSIVSKHADLEKGLIFRKKRAVEPKEFLKWSHEGIQTIQQTLIITSHALNEMFETESADYGPLKIKSTVEKLIETYAELLEWEIELAFLEPPDDMKHIKDMLKGSTLPLINEIETLPEKIHTAVVTLGTPNHKKVSFDYDSLSLPADINKALEAFNEYFNELR